MRNTAQRILPVFLALLLSLAAAAQTDFLQRMRAGIEGAARGMDQIGRKADELVGPGAPLLGDGQGSPYTERRNFSERYPTGAAPTVSVSNEFGDIRVDTWNERVVQVTAEVTAGAETAETAATLAQAIEIKVSPAEDLVEVKTLFPETRRDMGRISLAVQYRITIPRDASLVADNFFGDVAAQGIGGAIGLDVRYGAVDIGQAAGTVRVRSHGEFPVKAQGLAQGGSFQMKGARAEISDARGDIQVSNFGGSVALSKLGPEYKADITVDSGRADISIDPGANPDISATVVYGKLTSGLDMTRSGQGDRIMARHPSADAAQRMTINASFGDVNIEVRGAGAAPAPGGAEGQVFNGAREERVTVAASDTVQIEAAVPGSVRVEGVDEDSLRVTATRVVWMPTAAQAPQALEALQMQIRQEAGRVTVTTAADGDMARFGCTSYRIDLLVQVPRTLAVQVNAVDGVTSASGLGGDTNLNQIKGEVSAEHVKGALKLANRQGAVRVSDCAGPVEASAQYGDLRIERVFGRVTAQNAEGRTIIESPGGDVSARNTGGDVRLLSLEPVKGNMDLHVDKGHLSILIAPESSAALTVRAGQGRVQSNIPLSGSIGGERQEFTGRLGDGQYTVLLEAEGGDIVVN
jgi:hypothetical protein